MSWNGEPPGARSQLGVPKRRIGTPAPSGLFSCTRTLTGWSARLWRVLIYDVTGEGLVTLTIGRCCFSTTDTCPRASPLTAREAAGGAPGPASFGGRGRNPARAPPKGDSNRAPPVLLRILSGLSAPPDMTKRRGKRPGLRLKSRG
jgi:hypothetical protein